MAYYVGILCKIQYWKGYLCDDTDLEKNVASHIGICKFNTECDRKDLKKNVGDYVGGYWGWREGSLFGRATGWPPGAGTGALGV